MIIYDTDAAVVNSGPTPVDDYMFVERERDGYHVWAPLELWPQPSTHPSRLTTAPKQFIPVVLLDDSL